MQSLKSLLFWRPRSVVLTLGLLAIGVVCSAQSQSADGHRDVARPLDSLSSTTWCSLPMSDKSEFYKREQQDSQNFGRPSSHQPRDRDTASLQKLEGVVQGLGVANSTDAYITGKMVFLSSSGQSNPVPIAFKIRPNGTERVELNFSTGTSLFVADGKHSHISAGSHQQLLAPVTSADHEIAVLPQWSILRHRSDERYGLKSYGQQQGLLVIQLLAPERDNAQEELLMPRTPTCVVVDPNTNQIARIERLVRPETHLTRTHRESVVYSNYRQVNQVWVPFTQEHYLDGELYETLQIDSVTFDNHFQDGEFSWSK